jgi:hypothetical protein
MEVPEESVLVEEDVALVPEEEVAATFSYGETHPMTLYSRYAMEPTSSNLNRVVKSLDPIINKNLVALGEQGNPLMRNKAKVFAARAIKKFDGSRGAQIHTWVNNQLMQLRRAKREAASPIKVPERIQIDAYHLSRKEQEFMEDHGREPDVHELADYANMPVKRITKVREQFFKVPASGAISEDTVSNTETDFMQEAVSYVYEEADMINKKILEHRTGYGGKPILSNSELSAMLGVRPDIISKRSARLANQLTGISETLSKQHG